MAHILIVDDEEVLRDLLSQILETRGHTCAQAANGLEGVAAVSQHEFDLIITDIRMPEMGGLEFLREIEPRVESRTPCLIITALADEPQIAVKAVRLACDFLSKPFEMKTVLHAVDRALKLREAWKFRQNYERRLENSLHEKEQELRATHEGVLIGFAAMLEGKESTLDEEEQSTKEHCERVRDYCTMLALELGIRDETTLAHIRLGAVLHDIGKYRVPDHILMKRGPLNDEEWVEMRKHPEYGADFVSRIPFLAGASEIILNHHERWDGGGYPRGLKGEEIPLPARIFFVVDAFDAICEKRCYKDAQPPEVALAEVRRNAGTQFDPEVVAAFERVYDRLLDRQRKIRENGATDDTLEARSPSQPTVEDLAEALRREVREETRLAVSR